MEKELKHWTLRLGQACVSKPREVGTDERVLAAGVPAEVPSCVQTTLLQTGLIPDPLVADHIGGLRWVEDYDWTYTTDFELPRARDGERTELVFEGVNYEAEVLLNGHFLGRIEGTFVRHVFDVTHTVGTGNTLDVTVTPPPQRRQAVTIQCSYGWDWAQRLLPVGLWRRVMVRRTGAVRLREPFLVTRRVTDRAATADFSVTVDATPGEARSGRLELTLAGENFRGGRQSWSFGVRSTGRLRLKRTLRVKSPRLWWPNGEGPQNLYRLGVRFVGADGGTSDELTMVTGLRTLRMAPNSGAPEYIAPWTFEVNGRRLFARGGNWVPVDAMFRMTSDRYDALLGQARAAGMNLLRVWGGGIDESDQFYDLCDRCGILVWQEFFLGAPFNPGLSRQTYARSCRSAIIRIRNHPSLAMYCAANEIDPEHPDDQDLVDGLQELLTELDPTRPWRRSSPYGGGDSHLWEVGNSPDAHPYTIYQLPTWFRSESGFHASGPVQDVKRFLPAERLWPPNEMWQLHNEDLSKVLGYLKDYGPLESLPDYVRKQQLYQMVAVRYSLMSSMRSWPGCSGNLVWMLNEYWPSFSWGLLDYYAAPKPALCAFKRCFRGTSVGLFYRKDLWKRGDLFQAEAFAFGTEPRSRLVRAELRIFDMEGRELHRETLAGRVSGARAATLGEVRWAIPDSFDGVFFVEVRARADGKVLPPELYWFRSAASDERMPPVRVLLVSPDDGTHAFLRPLERNWVLTDLVRPQGGKVELPAASAAELAGKYHVLVLDGVRKPEHALGPDQTAMVAEAIRKGMGLLVTGRNGTIGSFGGGTPLAETLPIELPVRRPDRWVRSPEPLRITGVLRGHPAARCALEEFAGLKRFTRVEAKSQAEVVRSCGAGEPLLVTGQHGEGRVAVWTTGLQDCWHRPTRVWPYQPEHYARILLVYLAAQRDTGDESITELQAMTKLTGIFSPMNRMPRTRLELSARSLGGGRYRAEVANIGERLAFFVGLTAMRGSRIVPAEFSDNWFSMAPGEVRRIDLTVAQELAGTLLTAEAWNATTRSVKLGRRA